MLRIFIKNLRVIQLSVNSILSIVHSLEKGNFCNAPSWLEMKMKKVTVKLIPENSFEKIKRRIEIKIIYQTLIKKKQKINKIL